MMKKKLGPLPVWAWAAIAAGLLFFLYERSQSSSSSSSNAENQVDPNNPLGLTYAQENADIAQGIDPNTGQTYASEQAAADAGQNASTGGGGDGSSGSGGTSDDSAELAQLDTDLNTGFATLGTEIANGQGLTDSTQPGAAIAGEVTDIQAAASALEAAGLVGAPTPPGAGSSSNGQITTHPGGPFYKFYQAVTGKPPPATVSSSSLIYAAWKAGKSVLSTKQLVHSSGSGAAGTSAKQNTATVRTTTTHTSSKKKPPSSSSTGGKKHVSGKRGR